MIHIPDHIEELKSYSPGLSAAEQAKSLGVTTFAELWNNENNLGVPQKALERISKAAGKLNRYPDPISWELRTRLAELRGRKPEEIVVGNGSESILANIFKAFFTPEDTFITTQGTFVAVYIWANSSNVEFKLTPLNAQYGFDLDAILESIDHTTRMVYLSNVNNPTGTMISQEEIDGFLDSISSDIIVVIDEAYREYSNSLVNHFPDSARMKRPNVITLGTFSKAYGLAGMRVGYAVADKPLANALNKVRMTFAPSLLAQEAAIGALEDKSFLKETLKVNKAGLKSFVDTCKKLGLSYAEPYGNFIMIDLHQEDKAAEVTEQLRQKGVFVRLLGAFGLNHCIRVSTGTEKENAQFTRALKDII